jgi:RES domain-containing protein
MRASRLEIRHRPGDVRRPLELHRQAFVYAALDPAAAILEMAVHKRFKLLNAVAHNRYSFTIADLGSVGAFERQLRVDFSTSTASRPGAPAVRD